MGLCRIGNQLYLVDRFGIVIDEFGPRYAEFDLPIIDGLVRAPSSGEPALDERRADLAARVIEAVAAQPDLARRISQIDVRNLHDAVVLLDGDPALLHLGEDRFLERLQSYLDVATAAARTGAGHRLRGSADSTSGCTSGRHRRDTSSPDTNVTDVASA